MCAQEFDGAQIPLLQTILQFRRMGGGSSVAVDAVFLCHGSVSGERDPSRVSFLGVAQFSVAVCLCVFPHRRVYISPSGICIMCRPNVETIHAAPLGPLRDFGCSICFPYGCTNSFFFLFRPPTTRSRSINALIISVRKEKKSSISGPA